MACIPVYGEGRNVRDWLHVEDHVAAVWMALKAGGIGEVYNIGDSNEWANLDLVGRLCDLVDERTGRGPSRERITFVTDRLGHDLRYAIDSAKIRKELGWRPRHGFEKGLAATVDWYLAHRDWVEAAKRALMEAAP